MRRPRGPGGRFLTAEEIAAQKDLQIQNEGDGIANDDGDELSVQIHKTQITGESNRDPASGIAKVSDGSSGTSANENGQQGVSQNQSQNRRADQAEDVLRLLTTIPDVKPQVDMDALSPSSSQSQRGVYGESSQCCN